MNPDDFQPMESFPLNWRWEQNRSRITPDELLKIRPNLVANYLFAFAASVLVGVLGDRIGAYAVDEPRA